MQSSSSKHLILVLYDDWLWSTGGQRELPEYTGLTVVCHIYFTCWPHVSSFIHHFFSA